MPVDCKWWRGMLWSIVSKVAVEDKERKEKIIGSYEDGCFGAVICA